MWLSLRVGSDPCYASADLFTNYGFRLQDCACLWMVRDCQTICFFKKNSKVVVFFVVVRFTGDLESGEEKGGFLSSENGEWLKLVDMLWLLAFVVPPNHAGPCGFMDPSVFTGHSFLLCPSPFTFLSVCVCVCVCVSMTCQKSYCVPLSTIRLFHIFVGTEGWHIKIVWLCFIF